MRFINAAPNNAMQPTALHSMDVYEVHPRKDKRGVDLISDALRLGVRPTSLTQYRAHGFQFYRCFPPCVSRHRTRPLDPL